MWYRWRQMKFLDGTQPDTRWPDLLWYKLEYSLSSYIWNRGQRATPRCCFVPQLVWDVDNLWFHSWNQRCAFLIVSREKIITIICHALEIKCLRGFWRKHIPFVTSYTRNAYVCSSDYTKIVSTFHYYDNLRNRLDNIGLHDYARRLLFINGKVTPTLLLLSVTQSLN